MYPRGVPLGATSNHKATINSHSKNQPTVECTQLIYHQLRPRESSTGNNYAAYMYERVSSLHASEYITHQLTNQHSAAKSNLQNEQFRPQNNKMPQPVTSYRKPRLVCLNIFDLSFAPKPPRIAQPPRPLVRPGVSQSSKEILTHTHSHPLTNTPEGLKGATTTHSLSPKHQPVGSCRLETTPIPDSKHHLHTRIVNSTDQSATSLIRQPRRLRRAHSSLRSLYQAPLK
jgi:hypothetical protein